MESPKKPRRESFSTTKGTTLPIRDIRGQEYLEVKWRIVWFNEERPDWSIETEFIQMSDIHAICKATIKDEAGHIRSTGHKKETKAGFPDFMEKAETGAIGRALAFIGYGTQFTTDLHEEDRLADAPVEKVTHDPLAYTSDNLIQFAPPPKKDVGSYLISFGKHKGKALKDLLKQDLENYCDWILQENEKKGLKRDGLSNSLQEFLHEAEQYLYGTEPEDIRG